jgi:hypothetical protein
VVERVKVPAEQVAEGRVPPETVAEAHLNVTALAGTVLQLAGPPPNNDPLEATCKVQFLKTPPPVRLQVAVDDPVWVGKSGSEAANETVPGETMRLWMAVASGVTMAGVGWRGGFWPALKPAPAAITTASKHTGRIMRTSVFPAQAVPHVTLMVKVTTAV